MELRISEMSDEVKESLGEAQVVIDGYMYMYECIRACLGRFKEENNDRDDAINDVISVLESAENVGSKIVKPENLMGVETRRKKMEGLR